MASLTSAVQASCRAVTGTEYSFTGDLSAFLDRQSIASGSLSGRLLALINAIDPTVTDAAGALNYILYNQNFATIAEGIRVTDSFGTDAHAWIPGIGWVNGLDAKNFQLSDGTTDAAVDAVVGYVGDSGGGTITATQATAANKPILKLVGGDYSHQYDGVSDYISLDAVPFQMSDDHAVVQCLKLNSLVTASRYPFAIRSTLSTTPVVGTVLVASNGNVSGLWKDDAGTTAQAVALSAITAGSVNVIGLRKVANAKVTRLNGVAGTTNNTTMGATTVNSASIGASVSTSAALFADANVYATFAIKGTLTDADMLALEKLAALFGGVTL